MSEANKTQTAILDPSEEDGFLNGPELEGEDGSLIIEDPELDPIGDDIDDFDAPTLDDMDQDLVLQSYDTNEGDAAASKLPDSTPSGGAPWVDDILSSEDVPDDEPDIDEIDSMLGDGGLEPIDDPRGADDLQRSTEAATTTADTQTTDDIENTDLIDTGDDNDDDVLSLPSESDTGAEQTETAATSAPDQEINEEVELEDTPAAEPTETKDPELMSDAALDDDLDILDDFENDLNDESFLMSDDDSIETTVDEEEETPAPRIQGLEDGSEDDSDMLTLPDDDPEPTEEAAPVAEEPAIDPNEDKATDETEDEEDITLSDSELSGILEDVEENDTEPLSGEQVETEEFEQEPALNIEGNEPAAEQTTEAEDRPEADADIPTADEFFDENADEGPIALSDDELDGIMADADGGIEVEDMPSETPLDEELGIEEPQAEAAEPASPQPEPEPVATEETETYEDEQDLSLESDFDDDIDSFDLTDEDAKDTSNDETTITDELEDDTDFDLPDISADEDAELSTEENDQPQTQEEVALESENASTDAGLEITEDQPDASDDEDDTFSDSFDIDMSEDDGTADPVSLDSGPEPEIDDLTFEDSEEPEQQPAIEEEATSMNTEEPDVLTSGDSEEPSQQQEDTLQPDENDTQETAAAGTDEAEQAVPTEDDFFNEEEEGPITLSDDELDGILADTSDEEEVEGEEPEDELLADANSAEPLELAEPEEPEDEIIPEQTTAANDTPDNFFEETDDDEPITLSNDELDGILADTSDDIEEVESEQPDDDFMLEEPANQDIEPAEGEEEVTLYEEESDIEPVETEAATPEPEKTNDGYSEQEKNDLGINEQTTEDFFSEDEEEEPITLSNEELDGILADAGEEEEFESDEPISDESEPAAAKAEPLDENDSRVDLTQNMTGPGMPPREDLRKVISYLDTLLGELPDTIIEDFARSEYFNLYQNVMNKLDL